MQNNEETIMKTEYKLIVEYNYSYFEESIKNYINLGWELVGNHCSSISGNNYLYSQMMVKKTMPNSSHSIK